jgi:peptidyl-prolyl cis-trans isomerase SDCCAG10
MLSCKPTHASSSRQAEIKRMQDDLRALKKASGQDSDSDSDTSSTRRKRRKGPSYLEQELAKYQKGKGRAAARAGNKRSRRDEEDDLLEELGAFSKRVTGMGDEERDLDEDEGGEEEGLEVDDDVDWMKHRLKFVVDEKELTRRAEDEYSVSLSLSDRQKQVLMLIR